MNDKDDDSVPPLGPALATSAFEIKKRLLHRALTGESKYSPAEMIAMICEHARRANTLPPEHESALDKVRGVYEPRSIMALNAIEEALGTGRRFTAAPAEFLAAAPVTNSLH